MKARTPTRSLGRFCARSVSIGLICAGLCAVEARGQELLHSPTEWLRLETAEHAVDELETDRDWTAFHTNEFIPQ